MTDDHDLDRFRFSDVFLYPQFEYIYGALIAVVALLTLPLWVPLKFLNTHTLVNRALAKAEQMDTTGESDKSTGESNSL